MNRRQVVATLGSIGLSGCLRLVGSSGSETRSPTLTPTGQGVEADPTVTEPTEATTTDTPTERHTPTESPTETQTPRPSYPIGVSASGIENAEFLFATHIDTIRELSARIQWSKLDRTHSYIQRKKTYRVEGVNERGDWQRKDGGAVGIYRNGLLDFWREDLGNRFTYGEDESDNQGYEPAFFGIEVLPLLIAGDWGQPIRINEVRPAIWELSTDSANPVSRFPGYVDDDDVSMSMGEATLQVDSNGIIRSVEALYQIKESEDSGGDETTYQTKYQVDSIGETTVSEPSWLSKARERAPTATATLTDDRKFLQFIVESGNRLEDGTVLDFNDKLNEPGNPINIRLEEPLETGTVSYLFTESPAEEGSSGQISRGNQPADVDPITLDSDYFLGVRRRATHYLDTIDVP